MANKHSLMCGAGRADITPPIGTILYGYSPGRPAKTVGDPLTVTAILLHSNSGNALLVSCTICAISNPLCQRLAEAAGRAAGVPAKNVIISATHTHSGPNTSIDSAWGYVDTEYIENILLPGVIAAAKQAAENRKPAKIGVAETESDVGTNRRETNAAGRIVLGQDHNGPTDPTMTVVSFRGEDGKILANMIHYGCHCTACGCGPEITRDWAGVMMDMLEKESGAVTGFIAGFEGDQGPNLPNGKTVGDYQMALALGAKAGADAVRAFRAITQWEDAPVQVLHGAIDIPFLPLASKEEAEAHLAELGNKDALMAEGKIYLYNEYLRWEKVLLEYASGKPLKTHWHFDQKIITVGDVAILSCPFEAFIEIALRIRKGSPYRYTLNLCNAGGSMAYLPTEKEISRGGYEIKQFLCALRTVYPLPNNTDDYWVEQNLAILRN